MNKKTILAYVLIGLVIIGFFMYNQKSPEEIQKEKARQERIAQKKLDDKRLQEERENFLNEQFNKIKNDSTSVFHNVYNGEEKTITLENEKVSININTLGGHITSASLKEYKDQEGNNVVLFDSNDRLNSNDKRGDNRLEYTFQFKPEYGSVNTEKCYFTVVNNSADKAVLRLDFKEGRYIDFEYRLHPDSYIVDLNIKAHNMEELLSSSESMEIVWKQLLRQQEPGYDFEQRFTNLTYKLCDDDADNLSEMADEQATIAEDLSWIAYKNQFFSSILIAENSFNSTDIKSSNIAEGKKMLKECVTVTKTQFNPSNPVATSLQFYFGPNKFSTLKDASMEAINPENDLELEELIYFGWPIVRWINRYFIMYLFDILSSTGLNMGIVLLLLTLIVKLCVYPFTKKSYISSAKMRVLKPHIDALNEKYPKKEDQLKKQQETMALYQKYGASPMGGCLPMLIQMPIFIALFNFVPNAIELRQESFLWANDLSAFDALISWDSDLWLIGDHISIFCLLFSVTQIINTYYTSKLQPTSMGSPEMEQQQKMMRWMMYLMPVVFFFMFNEYSAGLNYYYFLSTLFSIIIALFLRKRINEDELLKKMEAYAEKNKDSVAKQSNMMARLEALQEQQKKMIEEREKMKNSRKSNAQNKQQEKNNNK